MKSFLEFIVAIALFFSIHTLASCADGPESAGKPGGNEPLLNLTRYKDGTSLEAHKDELVTVALRGKINHAGMPGVQNYHDVVSGVHVWLAEYPFSKQLQITSDEKGWWTMRVLKHKASELKVSFVYAKAGWITTKSNLLTVGDKDDVDLAIQYIDPLFFGLLIKPAIELMMKDMLPPGANAALKNAVVVTVGKKWASIHDDRLPHGDPGATVNAIPGAIGPLYFDESVQPNPTYSATSVDGGVAWLNVPKGAHVIRTRKECVLYCDVEFAITDADADDEVMLYIASPPDSVQGSNESGPGKN